MYDEPIACSEMFKSSFDSQQSLQIVFQTRPMYLITDLEPQTTYLVVVSNVLFLHSVMPICK